MNKLRDSSYINSKSFRNFKGGKVLYYSIITIFSLVITAPLFVIAFRFFPNITVNIGTIIRIDVILCFSIIYVVIFSLLRIIESRFLLSIAGSFILALALLQIFGLYSYKEVKDSYQDIISYVENNPIEVPFLQETNMTIRNAAKIKNSIDFTNPVTRDFAVAASVKYFSDENNFAKYGKILRYFSVFKVINQWRYVPDPQEFDYFAKASTSSYLLAGDCDDHAILMAAAIKAIGGEVRLIHTRKHLYPEVKVGKTKDLPDIYYLIKRQLFYKESLGNQVFYHIDRQSNIWLNFDYTGKYPGAKFLDQQILGILNI